MYGKEQERNFFINEKNYGGIREIGPRIFCKFM